VGLEWGPLILVSTVEELLERKSSGSGLEHREYYRGDPLRWPRDTLYPATSGGHSVGIVHTRTQATEFSFLTRNIGDLQTCCGSREETQQRGRWTS
jgi:hypothetical protein